jgi:hypothetical protein
VRGFDVKVFRCCPATTGMFSCRYRDSNDKGSACQSCYQQRDPAKSPGAVEARATFLQMSIGRVYSCDDECLRASRGGERRREPMSRGLRLLADMLSAYAKVVADVSQVIG